MWSEWRAEMRTYYTSVRNPYSGGFQWAGRHRFGLISTGTVLAMTGCV